MPQFKSQRLAHDVTRREQLYESFIEEASRLYADAYEHSEAEVAKLVKLYALVSKMRLAALPKTVDSADAVVRVIIETYLRRTKPFVTCWTFWTKKTWILYAPSATPAARNCRRGELSQPGAVPGSRDD